MQVYQLALVVRVVLIVNLQLRCSAIHDMQVLLGECIGIVAVWLVMPWRYVWARYFQQPGEAWRSARTDGPDPGKDFP